MHCKSLWIKAYAKCINVKCINVVRVAKPDRAGHTKAIVEFDSDQPLSILKPDFPCYIPNVADVNQVDNAPLDESDTDTDSNSSDTDGSHTPLFKGKTKRLDRSQDSTRETSAATIVRPKVQKSTCSAP